MTFNFVQGFIAMGVTVALVVGLGLFGLLLAWAEDNYGAVASGAVFMCLLAVMVFVVGGLL